MQHLEQIILGIDPGTNIMGFSIIKAQGKSVNVLILDVLRLEEIGSHPLKLKKNIRNHFKNHRTVSSG